MSLDFEDWQIVVEALPDGKSTYKALNNQGGYAITHIGQLRKKSGNYLTIEEIKLMYKSLYEYFSFCRGAFCGPLLFSGYDADGAIVWKNWGIPRIQAWKSQSTWFPMHAMSQTKQVPSSYMSQDSKWYEALRLAIHWLVEAQNASTVDTGIVQAQIGIELLTWAKFVEIEQMQSKEDFEKLSAAERMRLLLD